MRYVGEHVAFRDQPELGVWRIVHFTREDGVGWVWITPHHDVPDTLAQLMKDGRLGVVSNALTNATLQGETLL